MLVGTTAAYPWFSGGHKAATELALSALPAEVPEFFRKGGAAIGADSAEPDIFTRPQKWPQLRDAEAPEQFFDLELLGDSAVPPKRSAFIELCATKGIKPGRVGFVPYAAAEWTQRLTFAFAQHRRNPDDVHIQHKCLVYAGLLAHYAQDLCQPLHTTVDYDGRAKPDGSSPKSGIHVKVDALLGRAAAPGGAVKAEAFDDVFSAVMDRLKTSHALVEKVYQLEGQFPAVDAGAAPIPADGDVGKFAAERLTTAASLTASLYLTAWRDSAEVKEPDWAERGLTSTSRPVSSPATKPSK